MSSVKICAMKAALYLRANVKFSWPFHISCQIWIKLGTGNVCSDLLMDCELSENRCSENHALPRAFLHLSEIWYKRRAHTAVEHL
jgi:hypothetical protein